jgi:hypothetical protein
MSMSEQFPDLRLSQAFSNGRHASMNLTTHSHPVWAREFLKVLRSELKVTGSIKSPAAVEHYAHAFRQFGLWLAADDRILTSFVEVTSDDIDGFEDFLYEEHGSTSRHAYTTTAHLVRLIRLAGEYVELPPTLAQRLLTTTRRGLLGDDKRREPYSDYVAEQLLDAAARQIEEARERLNAAPAEYETKRRISKHHRNVYDFLKFVEENGPIMGKRLLGKFQNRLARSLDESGLTKSPVDLYQLLYLNSTDLTAFTIAISLLTGIPIESVRELKNDCLANESGSYSDVRYVKRRTGHEEEQAVRCPATGTGWTGPGLIKLAQQLTSSARKVAAPSEAQWLLVGYGKQTPSGFDQIRRLKIKSQDCTRFCEKYPVFGDDGQRLRTIALARLRKTYKAQRYKSSPTTARLAGDHSPRIHDFHYANVEAMKQIHERTIEEALLAALNNAMHPTILTEEIDPDEEPLDQASDLDDVWMAGCKDITNSPFNKPGTTTPHCQSPVWGCLTCKNAVISAANLPAILAFLDHVIFMRQALDLGSWASRYGYAFGQITVNILPKFSSKQLEDARAIASEDSQLLWLPAELTKGW